MSSLSHRQLDVREQCFVLLGLTRKFLAVLSETPADALSAVSSEHQLDSDALYSSAILHLHQAWKVYQSEDQTSGLDKKRTNRGDKQQSITQSLEALVRSYASVPKRNSFIAKESEERSTLSDQISITSNFVPAGSASPMHWRTTDVSVLSELCEDFEALLIQDGELSVEL